MDRARGLEYPFAATEQGPRETAMMREFIAGYLDRHPLFSDPDKYSDTVVHFARFCTPHGTSEEGLACACMYMAWVLYLDDVSDGSIGEINSFTVSRYAEIVDPPERSAAPPARSAADAALSELVSRVRRIAERRCLDPREFCDRLLQMMRAQVWERERVAVQVGSPSRSEYLRHRPAAIGNGAFVSIMKLDHGVDLERTDPLTRARAILLDELTTRLVYVSNDVLSHHREQHDPSALSLVRIIADEQGIAWVEAVDRATACHARDVEAYCRLRQEMLDNPDATVLALVTILDTDVAGNLEAMTHIRSRYMRPGRAHAS